jgi:hypothetical protein
MAPYAPLTLVVAFQERLPRTKKPREFTRADVDAVILRLGEKPPDQPTRRSARAIA